MFTVLVFCSKLVVLAWLTPKSTSAVDLGTLLSQGLLCPDAGVQIYNPDGHLSLIYVRPGDVKSPWAVCALSPKAEPVCAPYKPAQASPKPQMRLPKYKYRGDNPERKL